MKLHYLIGAALLAGTPAVLAGAVVSLPVTVTVNADGSGSATGAMTTARFSDDHTMLIGCGVVVSEAAGGFMSRGAWCQARQGDDARVECHTENFELIETIRSLSAYSRITFHWRPDGTCSTISFSTQSLYIPGPAFYVPGPAHSTESPGKAASRGIQE